jgi:hypothetical protein
MIDPLTLSSRERVRSVYHIIVVGDVINFIIFPVFHTAPDRNGYQTFCSNTPHTPRNATQNVDGFRSLIFHSSKRNGVVKYPVYTCLYVPRPTSRAFSYMKNVRRDRFARENSISTTKKKNPLKRPRERSWSDLRAEWSRANLPRGIYRRVAYRQYYGQIFYIMSELLSVCENLNHCNYYIGRVDETVSFVFSAVPIGTSNKGGPHTNRNQIF